ncbi:Obstructor-E [Operophtera brumata]|uniref:Obstructor-E n=1 Tax=Operophtera brumata TaxID=104452 RepID=A0A0L7KUM0_OPEBR|nr:Obstructor-E [Operophtera brumata]
MNSKSIPYVEQRSIYEVCSTIKGLRKATEKEQTSAQYGSQFNSRFQQPASQQYQQTNQYQQNQQYQTAQQQPAQRTSAGACRELNERYPVSGSCDRYIECINGTSEEKTCPDGLRFNPNVNFNVYPCQYPNEVSCLERSALQPAQPTEQCPHQFGYYKIGDARNCSGFRTCVNGVGFDFVCPEGLAWSSESYRCEWPDEVADCDAEAFLGFRCPEVPQTKELGPPAGFRYYRSDANCQKYFLCIEGRPRILSCGSDAAFDDLTTSCVSADQVSACPAELRATAAAARESEKQLLAKELEFDGKSFGKSKRRF